MMKFCFLSLMFCRYPLEYSFRMARQYGFDGVEIWGARPHAYPFDVDAEAAQLIRHYKKQYALEVPVYTPEILAYPYNLVSSSTKERKETVEYLRTAIRVCNAIECGGMLLTAGHPGYGRDANEVWSELVEGVQALCDEGARYGVKIIMETLGHYTSPVVSRTDDILRLAHDVGRDNFRAMLDIAIPPLVGEPVSEYFDKAGSIMEHVHLCGCDGIYETHLQLTGGSVPMEDILTIFDRFGYDKWCSVEVLDPYYSDPERYLIQNKRLLDSIAARV